MTRALVLGGGGPVGIGWEAGLLVGLGRGGVDPTADLVVGTSAGSVVGFTLASGGDLTEAIALVAAANEGTADAAGPAPAAGDTGLEALLATVAEAALNPADGDAIRARLGQLALTTETVDEQLWLAMFATFAGAAWPASFRCTAVDVADGTFKVWGPDDQVDPQLAVASSCAVPCLFPPVSINGGRWMDGGVRDMVNADVASGHDVVLAVSCTLLELPAELNFPPMDAIFAATRAQLDRMRHDGSKVETIVPSAEMLEISEWGMALMDFGRAGAAYEAGVRQGEAEAERLAGFWA